MAADSFLACKVCMFFPANCGDQVDRAAEGPDLPSGGNAQQGLVVCGNGGEPMPGMQG